jgi:hypothetical protein
VPGAYRFLPSSPNTQNSRKDNFPFPPKDNSVPKKKCVDSAERIAGNTGGFAHVGVRWGEGEREFIDNQGGGGRVPGGGGTKAGGKGR